MTDLLLIGALLLVAVGEPLFLLALPALADGGWRELRRLVR